MAIWPPRVVACENADLIWPHLRGVSPGQPGAKSSRRSHRLTGLLGCPPTARISSPIGGVVDVAGRGAGLCRGRVISSASGSHRAPLLLRWRPFVLTAGRLGERRRHVHDVQHLVRPALCRRTRDNGTYGTVRIRTDRRIGVRSRRRVTRLTLTMTPSSRSSRWIRGTP